MSLQVVSHDDHIAIHGKDMTAWNRISQLMRRNGIRIQHQAAGSWAFLRVWWVLPVVGFTFFLMTLIFGGALADMIWEPPPSRPVMDLRANQSANDGSSRGPSTTDAGTQDGANFLAEALRTSEAQQFQPENQVSFAEQDANRQTLTLEEITLVLESACVDLAIGNRRRKATRLTEDGRLMTDYQIQDYAFRNESRTVEGREGFFQRMEYVVPMASLRGQPAKKTRLLEVGEDAELALLKSPINADIAYYINFDRDLNMSDEVWVSDYTMKRFFPIKAQIVDTVSRRGKALMYVLDSSLTVTNSGTPVLNIYGDVVGVLLVRNNQNFVVSLYQMRDKSPMLFRELQ